MSRADQRERSNIFRRSKFLACGCVYFIAGNSTFPKLIQIPFFFAVGVLHQELINYILSHPLDKYIASSEKDKTTCESFSFDYLAEKLRDVCTRLDFTLEGAALQDNFDAALQVMRDIRRVFAMITEIVHRVCDRDSKLFCHYKHKIMVSLCSSFN